MQKAVSLNFGNETGETVASACLFTARSGCHLGDQNHSSFGYECKTCGKRSARKKQYHSHLGTQSLVVTITHRPCACVHCPQHDHQSMSCLLPSGALLEHCRSTKSGRCENSHRLLSCLACTPSMLGRRDSSFPIVLHSAFRGLAPALEGD